MQPESNQQPASQWQYTPETEDGARGTGPLPQNKQTISWTASEYVDHHKSAGWYGLLILAAALIMGLIYIVTRDLVSLTIVAIVTILLGITAARKPRTLQYSLTTSGITIGSQSYPFANFKSFSIIDEGALNSISLFPMKRFMPPMSLYYDPKDEEQITAMLGNYLPFIEGQKDTIDRFLHRIRF